MEHWKNEGYEMLVNAILSLKNGEEVALFLEDLMTRKEIDDAAQRMLVAKLLSEKVVYSKIAEKTGASTATISRVNRSYQYGAGGYRTVLERIEKNNEEENK
ncbi:MAG: DNA-binding transcriptional regulator [Clostridia bacterium]|nr:DNA-binding transcriptional regulator [Clostridia bacterium]